MSHCWGQDALDAAILGLPDTARKQVVEELTYYGNKQFPWFWSKNSDWIPDMDNGGAGMAALQLMLMQCDGRRILLLPAWPRDWTADFKLHAPYQTIVEGHVENGKISNLKVTPRSRARDVVVLESTNLSFGKKLDGGTQAIVKIGLGRESGRPQFFDGGQGMFDITGAGGGVVDGGF